MTDQLKGSNPFWDYSLQLYARPGVAPACLALQEQYAVDVNLLLFSCFAAACGVELAAAELERMDLLVAPWREQLVLPLRAQRQLLRPLAGRLQSAAALREQIKRLELAAERQQQQHMWEARNPPVQWSPADALAGTVAATTAANLAQLAHFYQIPVAECSVIEQLLRVPG